jgi:hypothetical protein
MNGIYNTTNADSSFPDIRIGTSGTAKLYSVLFAVRTTQHDHGIYEIDTGSTFRVGCQVGNLTIETSNAASPPAGSNGGHTVGCRITDDIVCNISNASFSANLIGGDIEFGENTSGVGFGQSNGIVADTRINNLGNAAANYICVNRGTGSPSNALGGMRLCYGASHPANFVSGPTDPRGARGAGAEWWILPSADGNNMPDVGNASLGTPGYLFSKVLQLLNAAGSALFNALSVPSGTNLSIGDGSGYINVVANSTGILLTANSTEQMRIASSKVSINRSLLGNYANDAAAATGGVAVGQLYRNGSVLMVRMA